jgi:hypothetical protein
MRCAPTPPSGLTESERDMAEHDAWYVFGIENVVTPYRRRITGHP